MKKGHTINLQDAVRHYPTPTKCGNHNRKGISKTSGDGLATVVKNIPTPQNRDFRSGQSKRVGRKGYQTDLNDFVKKYPTPTRQDACNNGGASQFKRNTQPLNTFVKESPFQSGNLNPDWVEWLMGWFIGWSDLKPLKELKMLDISKDPFPDIQRVTKNKENRVNRLKGIGNGQVPLTFYHAFQILNQE